jgi:hypothetical protein
LENYSLNYNSLVYIPYPYHRCLIEVYSCEDWLWEEESISRFRSSCSCSMSSKK